MNYYVDVLKKYAVFDGRARRKEFWMFTLINLIVSLVLGFIFGMIHLGLLANLYSLAVLLPSVGVAIRRMHDTDHKGWWLLVPIYSLYLACIDGTPGPNRFGENPKGIPAVQGFPVIQTPQ